MYEYSARVEGGWGRKVSSQGKRTAPGQPAVTAVAGGASECSALLVVAMAQALLVLARVWLQVFIELDKGDGHIRSNGDGRS